MAYDIGGEGESASVWKELLRQIKERGVEEEDFSGSLLLRISDPPQALMVQLPQELVQGGEMLRRDLFVGAQYGLITIRLPGMLIDREQKQILFWN